MKKRNTVTVTISGVQGSGKSAIMGEISRCLKKAGLKLTLREEEYNSLNHDDYILGKKLDIISKRIVDGELEVIIQDVTIRRVAIDDEVNF